LPATAIAIDTSGRFYVAVREFTEDKIKVVGLKVLIFNAGARGAPTPIQTVELPFPGGQTYVTAMTVDAQKNLYLVIGGDERDGFEDAIYAFLRNPRGDYTVSRIISGSLSRMSNVSQIAVDPGKQIYVANVGTGSVLIFNSDAAGNSAPAEIPNSNPAFSGPGGVALDSAGNIYASYRTKNIFTGNLRPHLFIPSQALVYVFPPGSVTPSRTVFSSLQMIYDVGNLAVDASGDIYLAVHTMDVPLEIFKNGSSAFQPDELQYGLVLY
jgi:DNA-binding beta-propeller fold protein YncE